MRALSVRQPWAELIATGAKTIEVRKRVTYHRGPLLICAGVAWHKLGVQMHSKVGSRGVAICLVEIVDCRPITPVDQAASGGIPHELVAGQFAWVLANPRRVNAVPVSGQLSMFTPPQEVVRLLGAA